MEFSKAELRILEQIAGGNREIKKIALALSKNKSQIYNTGQKLISKGIITRAEGLYKPNRITHVTLLLQLLSQNSSIISSLSNSGLKLLTSVLEEKKIAEIAQETGLKNAMIFRKLKEARRISMVSAKNREYFINKKIWPDANEFLLELKKYEEATDSRVPANSKIYFKNEKEIIFSTKESVDAVLTAFSAYSNYGIKILLPEPIYCLPKSQLTLREIFLHSLYFTDKERSASHLSFITLFYVKFRGKLSKIKHPLIDSIKKILAGEKIPGYPELNEIREKGDVYDITI